MAAMKDEKPRYSLAHFVEKTAQSIRKAALAPFKKKQRKYEKQVSISNKITQVARLLRKESNSKK